MSVPYERPLQPSKPPGVARPKPKPIKDFKPNVQRPAARPGKGPGADGAGVQLNKVKPPVKIFAEGASYSAANSAYNSAKGALKGFVKDPSSPTGWSFIDPLGRKAASRPPMRNERVISPQQIQKLNPNFYKPAQAAPKPAAPAGPSAPWLQGFTGGGGWAQTTDGGWWNGESGQYWKPGSPVPGAPAQQQGNDINALYASLLKMFEGL